MMKNNGIRKMCKFGLIFLLLLPSLNVFSLPGMAVNQVFVDDHGAVPNDGLDDGQAIRKAADAAVALGAGTEVIFSTGTYHTSPPPTAWEFNTDGNLEGWTMMSQVTGEVSGGSLNLTITGSNPYMHSPNYLNMDAGKFKLLKIRMKNSTTSTSANIYWITDSDSTYNESKKKNITINALDTGYTEYVVDLNSHSGWSGVIKQIRVNPEYGAAVGTVNIDYIRAETPPLKAWDFNTDGDFEGWSMANQVTGSVSGGALNLTVSGSDPQIKSPDNLNINSGQYPKMTIRMKNETTATKGQLYWITDTDTTWDTNKRVEYTITANDSDYKEYSISLGSKLYWTGTIKQLRVDPEEGASSGVVKIGFIHLVPTTPILNIYNFLKDGISGITFKGTNTEIISTDPMAGMFKFTNSSNITVQGFTFDYQALPFVQGEVVAVDSTAGTFDYVVESGYTLLDDPRMADVSSKWGTVRDPSNVYLQKSTAKDFIDIKSWVKLNANTYRMTVPDNTKYVIGSANHLNTGDKFVMIIRGTANNIINFRECNTVTVQDVTVHASSGISVISYYTNALTVNNLNVVRRPASGRWVTTNADGVHVQAARSGPWIDNSTFEGMHDDAVAIYAKPSIITEVISTTQVKVSGFGGGKNPLAGDKIQVYDPVNGRTRGTATVTNVEALTGYAASSRAILTLDTAIIGMVAGVDHKTADTIYNLNTYASGFYVKNSTFRESRRYGNYLKASNGVIENNTYTNIGGSAVIIQNEPDAPNGPVADNILVKNNVIDGVAFLAVNGNATSYSSAIRITSEKLGFKMADERGQTNITIQNNTIKRILSRSGMYLSGVDNIQIIGTNSIEASSTDPVFDGKINGVKLTNASNVVVDGLTIIDPRAELDGGIVIDSASPNISTRNLSFTLAAGVPSVLYHAISAPTGLTGTVVSDTQINLDWADNTEATLASYNVYRSTTSGFTPSWNNRIAIGVTSSAFTDTGLSTSTTTYYYKVTAVDTAGVESAASKQAFGYLSDYNVDADFEGWSMMNQVTGTVSGGLLNLTVSGTDPYIRSADNLGMDASKYRTAKVKMRNNTTAATASFYFITNTDTVWNETKKVSFSITASDSKYTEYTVNLGSNAAWTGTIKRLRFDPENGASAGSVHVDSINIMN
ncbi:MAG TPA: hypothetical protein VGE40_12770 [Bacilli bacterium]